MPPELVIFDFDGTLADTRESIVTCMQLTFEFFGAPIPSDDAVGPTIGLRLGDAIQSLHPEVGEGDVAMWVQVYRDFFGARGEALMRLYGGVAEVLEGASRLGVPLVLLSNRSHASLERGVARLGIAEAFRLVLGDRPGQPRKPDPVLHETLIRPSFQGVGPEQTLVVGDTETDLAFARALGSPSCWASYGFGEADRCQALEPDHVIRSPAELGGILGLP